MLGGLLNGGGRGGREVLLTGYFLDVLISMYSNDKSAVKIDNKLTESFTCHAGARHLPSKHPIGIGLPTPFLVVITFCVFSPLLYIVESNQRLFPDTT